MWRVESGIGWLTSDLSTPQLSKGEKHPVLTESQAQRSSFPMVTTQPQQDPSSVSVLFSRWHS